MRKTILLTILVALAATPMLATELLQNNGFESGQLSPWFQARDFCGATCVDWNASTENPHSGKYSAMDQGNIELRQDFTPTLGSDITNVSFWAYAGAGLGAIDFFYTDNSDEEFLYFGTANVWTFVDATSDVNKGKMLMGISVWGADPNYITFYDDFSVTSNAVPEPGSLILLGSGLLGLAGMTRRKFNL